MQQILFRTLCLLFGLVLLTQTNAQIAISPDGTPPDSSAMLDIQSTSKGLLIPRMTTMQLNSIADPATGLLVFNSDSAAFYFYSGSTWKSLDSGINDDWTIDGNTVTNSNRRQIEIDSSRISFINTYNNIFLGDSAGFNNPLNSPSSIRNIGIGASSLHQNTAGEDNLALGFRALYHLTAGHDNTALGYYSLYQTTTGFDNIAVGSHALEHNTAGNDNIGLGYHALNDNITGDENIGIGRYGLQKNTTGNDNISLGASALNNNTTGHRNISLGRYGLTGNTSGNDNIALGYLALESNLSGSKNIAIGQDADVLDPGLVAATAIGYNALVGCDDCIVLGDTAAAKVGIGTATPDTTLHVSGKLKYDDGTQGEGYVLTSDANGNASWAATQTDNLGNHTATQNIQLGSHWLSGDGGNEGLQITNDGTVKFSSRINTNNQWITGDDNTDEGIQIEDVGRVNVRAYVIGQDQFVMKIENTANGNNARDDGLGIIAGHASYNSGQQSSFVQFTSPDGDYCGRVRQSGNNAVEYVSASDERLKENIRPTKYGLNDLMKIEVVDYNYRTDKPEDVQTGYLAQQLYTAFPHPVDVGGEDPKTQPWGVDYGALSPLLVSAAQELAKRMEQLEKENAWLKVENASLKGNYAALSSDVEMLKAILNTVTQVSK